MNNNYFSLGRYLIDDGHDVKLFLLNEQSHFYPENDCYDLGDLNFVEELDWYDIGHWKIKKEQLLKVISEFDVCIVADTVPAFFFKAGKRADFMFPHGGEIFSKPFFHFNPKKPWKSQLGEFIEKYQLRKGLAETKMISVPIQNDFYENCLVKLKIKKNRGFNTCPIIYYPQYFSNSFREFQASSKYYQLLKFEKSEGKIIIFSHTRHELNRENDQHYKGNDKLIRSFADLTLDNKKIRLVLFENGNDYKKSKELVNSLEIEEFVIWFPKLSRKEIMPLLPLVDVGVGNLGDVKSTTYGVLFEFLIFNIPVIQNGVEFDQDCLDRNAYFFLQANSLTEVKKVLKYSVDDLDSIKGRAAKGLDWIKLNMVEKPLSMIYEFD